MISAESYQIWKIKSGFKKIRAGFYRDLGAALEGGASMMSFVSTLASKEAGNVSKMMRLWRVASERIPDSLARATRPYVTASDSIVIKAAEQSKEPWTLYKTYARNLEVRALMIKTITIPLIMPAFTVVAVLAVYGFFKFAIYDKLGKTVKQEYWVPVTKNAYNVVNFVWGWQGGVLVVLLVAFGVWAAWSFANFTHPLRRKLDRFGVHKLVAQMEMLSVLSVMASLIRSGRSDMEAVALIQGNASPWMRDILGRVKAHTLRYGTPILGSLIQADVPISPVLATRLEILAAQAKPDQMPGQVIQACDDEATALVSRMDAMSKLITALTTVVLVVAVGVVMLGVLGISDSARVMGDARSMRHH